MTSPSDSRAADTGAPDPRAFRQALGDYATGVTVITARTASGQMAGVTINSFASVSLEPPLVLWSLGLHSPSMAVFEACEHYAINVLAAGQADLSLRFATPQENKFSGIDWRAGTGGAPLLAGCCAWFECANDTTYPGGDHLIFIGRVLAFRREAREPLVFHGGRYRELM